MECCNSLFTELPGAALHFFLEQNLKLRAAMLYQWLVRSALLEQGSQAASAIAFYIRDWCCYPPLLEHIFSHD